MAFPFRILVQDLAMKLWLLLTLPLSNTPPKKGVFYRVRRDAAMYCRTVPAGREHPFPGWGMLAARQGWGLGSPSRNPAAATRFPVCPLLTELLKSDRLSSPRLKCLLESVSRPTEGVNNMLSSWEEAYFCFLKVISYDCWGAA